MFWSAGLWMLLIGYALLYTGLSNLRNGGNGPRLTESLGWTPVATPSVTGVARA